MIQIHEGDCLDVMRRLAGEGTRMDSIVSDTPYHLKSIVARFGKTSLDDDTDTGRRARGRSDGAARLTRGFMGRSWDGGDVSQRTEVWRAAYRLLKPGGWLLAMSSTRTQHRMVCAIEDAGFEIRDMIGWMYAQGFSPNRSMRDGEGVRLKPAWEPICVARKPLREKTVQENLDRYGVGALRTQDCRVALVGRTDPRLGGAGSWSTKNAAKNVYGDFAGRDVTSHEDGRFPANLILDGSDCVRALFPDSAGQQDDDDLSAARFFYCAKATRAERAFEHPTVKPLALMRYLVRLVTPPGGLVLDPFAGTGQTGFAARQEGRRSILIEKEPDYAEGLRQRLVLTEQTERK